jgi:hypothetical protein
MAEARLQSESNPEVRFRSIDVRNEYGIVFSTDMSADSKKSIGWTVVLIFLGMAALYGGWKWLGLLIPAALLVWYNAKPRLGTGRN